jgi:hypothetical protein
MIHDTETPFPFDDARRAILKTDKDIENLKREINIKSAGKALIEKAIDEAGGEEKNDELLLMLREELAMLPDELAEVVNFVIEHGLNTEFTTDEIKKYLGEKGASFLARARRLNTNLYYHGVPYRLSPRPGEGIGGISTHKKHFKFYRREGEVKDRRANPAR